MKKNKTLILITLFLVLSVFIFTTCKRDAVETPSPIGPSTYAILLNLNANPNVLFAGLASRQMTTVTATLKKYNGTPLADKTVFFEIVNGSGTRVDLGYFEGTMSLQSKNTDSSGTVRVNYYGPLSEEIDGNGTIYIKATVAWEGSEFIYETAPLYIIRDADEINFTVEAIPDILYAGLTAPRAEIRATLLAGGVPVKDYPVYFILEQDLGRFADGKRNTYAMTNEEGVASVTYIGPAYNEILTNTTVTISVQLTQSVSEQVTIQIIRLR